MDFHKLIFLVFLLSLIQETFNLQTLTIVPGITSYSIPKQTSETFKFVSIDDGYYLFSFGTYTTIIEVVGEIHQDISVVNDFTTTTMDMLKNLKKEIMLL